MNISSFSGGSLKEDGNRGTSAGGGCFSLEGEREDWTWPSFESTGWGLSPPHPGTWQSVLDHFLSVLVNEGLGLAMCSGRRPGRTRKMLLSVLKISMNWADKHSKRGFLAGSNNKMQGLSLANSLQTKEGMDGPAGALWGGMPLWWPQRSNHW